MLGQMSAEQFAYWLQRFVELCPNSHPSKMQWQAIKDHLALVHTKVTTQRISITQQPNISPYLPQSCTLATSQ